MSQLIDLAHPLEHGQPSFPGDPQLTIAAHTTVSDGAASVARLVMGTHQGTHLDAPSHVFADGRTVDELPLEQLFGPAHLVDFAPGGVLEPGTPLDVPLLERHANVFYAGARVIYRTGWDRRFGREDFFRDYPSLTLEAARWIAGRRIRLLGMDTPSPAIDWRECHQVLLRPGGEIVIVECLANLDRLPAQFTFVGFPLKLKGCDGSPIRAVAWINR